MNERPASCATRIKKSTVHNVDLLTGPIIGVQRKMVVNLYAGRFPVKLIEKRTHFFKVGAVEGKIMITTFFAALQQFAVAQ